jgi:threonine/homoserine/homoserine lactone efflux protein
MVDLHMLLSFITAVTVLMLIPGPDVALIVANSVASSVRRA